MTATLTRYRLAPRAMKPRPTPSVALAYAVMGAAFLAGVWLWLFVGAWTGGLVLLFTGVACAIGHGLRGGAEMVLFAFGAVVGVGGGVAIGSAHGAPVAPLLAALSVLGAIPTVSGLLVAFLLRRSWTDRSRWVLREQATGAGLIGALMGVAFLFATVMEPVRPFLASIF